MDKHYETDEDVKEANLYGNAGFEIRMANGNHNTRVGRYVCVIIAIAYMLGDEYVEGRKIAPLKNSGFVKHKGTVKTIKSDIGDVIDCVDIYKQPAFDHPLLKNHTLEMKPNSYPSGVKQENNQAKIVQSWHKSGQCPEGTVPIRRTQKHENHRAILLSQRITQLNHSFAANPQEYAQVSIADSKYYGAHALINVWNPTTGNGEFSKAQIWVLSGGDVRLNSIEAGLMVNPDIYHDNQTRFFLRWTRDNHQSTGCYDLNCPGFVQTSQKFVIGFPVKPVSGYGAKQYDIAITIYKDKKSGNWWLQVQDEVLGWWPGSIFSDLAEAASTISWGGEIINTNSGGHHTSTQMGSGHFPSEGYGKSSYIRNLAYVDDSGNQRNPENPKPYVTNPSCYDLHVEKNIYTDYGTYFYYGGPGYSEKCP